MVNGQFSFAAFIRRVRDMDYHEIIAEAEAEADSMERASYRVKGAVRNRQAGSMDYVRQIEAFLFWLRTGGRPAGASEEDFQAYRQVAQRLVAKGQFRSEVLAMFHDAS